MPTAQEAIDKLRIKLGETDPLNSRWDDATHLLYYVNLGRREFAKRSLALKAIFQRTTTIGATVGNRFARYTLDPTVWEIDNIYWDDTEVEAIGLNEFEEFQLYRGPDHNGRPFIFRRVGDSIDLYYAPDSAKVLEVYASILTTDLSALNSSETELNADQLECALNWAAFQALSDDDRDGQFYLQQFGDSIKMWRKRVHRKGPRFVNQVERSWPM